MIPAPAEPVAPPAPVMTPIPMEDAVAARATPRRTRRRFSVLSGVLLGGGIALAIVALAFFLRPAAPLPPGGALAAPQTTSPS